MENKQKSLGSKVSCTFQSPFKIIVKLFPETIDQNGNHYRLYFVSHRRYYAEKFQNKIDQHDITIEA